MGMTGNKSAGLALMGGVILSIPAFLFHPGGIFISPVDLNDFPATIEVLTDHASLTHIITMALVLSVFLEAYGFFALTRIRSRAGSLSGYALRFGVIGMLFSYGALALEYGTRHMVVHIATHGVTGESGTAPALAMPDLALTIYAAGIALHITFLFVSALAALLLGLGLAAHFATLNIYRIAGYGVGPGRCGGTGQRGARPALPRGGFCPAGRHYQPGSPDRHHLAVHHWRGAVQGNQRV